MATMKVRILDSNHSVWRRTCSVVYLPVDAVITNDEWHHVGLVWDGIDTRLYVDGVENSRDIQTGLGSADDRSWV